MLYLPVCRCVETCIALLFSCAATDLGDSEQLFHILPVTTMATRSSTSLLLPAISESNLPSQWRSGGLSGMNADYSVVALALLVVIRSLRIVFRVKHTSFRLWPSSCATEPTTNMAPGSGIFTRSSEAATSIVNVLRFDFLDRNWHVDGGWKSSSDYDDDVARLEHWSTMEEAIVSACWAVSVSLSSVGLINSGTFTTFLLCPWLV